MSPPRKSVVWKDFQKSGSNTDKVATCNMCKKAIKFFGRTTYLKQHLIRIHPLVKLDFPPMKKMKLMSIFQQVMIQNNERNNPGPSNTKIRTEVQSKPAKVAKQFMLYGSRLGNMLSEAKISFIDQALLKMVTLETLDAEEWSILGDILKPANDLTTILSGEKYPSLSLNIPLIRGSQYTLKNFIHQTDVGEKLKQTLLETVKRRLGGFESNKIVAKACFLDPRFKKIAFGSEDNANNKQKCVVEEMTQLISNKAQVVNTPEIVSETLIFPEMYELAMKYLCVSATSVPTEKVFFKNGPAHQFKKKETCCEKP
ncbi:unnamed protein product [Brassicogethes aeneus]|uniref:BED-type domain-containing protein n=1 Tax=Brassicogethes aeneus TaxID=1431903 RepID=A0A9P0FL51_BRAAE|nr:unnamed protein product [Brassicogethes aeneus]